jgi:hypothetical protein
LPAQAWAQLTSLESPEISLAKLGRQTHEEITKYVEQNQRPPDSTAQEGMIGLTLDDTESGQELLKLWLKVRFFAGFRQKTLTSKAITKQRTLGSGMWHRSQRSQSRQP